MPGALVNGVASATFFLIELKADAYVEELTMKLLQKLYSLRFCIFYSFRSGQKYSDGLYRLNNRYCMR